MSNPYSIYKANYINNLPFGVTYNPTIARFFFNGKSFFTPQAVESYRLYLKKFSSFDILDLNPVAFYDSGDASTLFQDAAGTTPSSAGDPVALWLDKSEGVTVKNIPYSNITDLFYNYESGGYYSAEEVTMWQDASGSIPVTEPGQPVAVWLDKSHGVTVS